MQAKANPVIQRKGSPKAANNRLTWVEHDIRTKDEQRARLWDHIREWTGHPLLVDFCAKLIEARNIPAKDDLRLVQEIQQFVQHNVKYFREFPERWQSPIRTLTWKIGDCDDQTILVCCLLRTFRIPMRTKHIRYPADDAGTPVKPESGLATKKLGHVYSQAKLPGIGWVSLETVKPVPLGWDAADWIAETKGVPSQIDYAGDR